MTLPKLSFLVNVENKTAILFGDGKTTSEFDLRAWVNTMPVVPQCLRQITEMMKATRPPESIPQNVREVDLKAVQFDKVAMHIYVNQCRRPVPMWTGEEERGDADGEFYGIPLDDGLAPPRINDYRIVAVHGLEREALDVTVEDALRAYSSPHRSTILNGLREKAMLAPGSHRERQDRFSVMDLVSRIDNNPTQPVEFSEAYQMLLLGAAVRATRWSADERIRIVGTGEARAMHYEYRSPLTEEWRHDTEFPGRAGITWDDTMGQWLVTTL